MRTCDSRGTAKCPIRVHAGGAPHCHRDGRELFEMAAEKEADAGGAQDRLHG